MEKVKLVEFLSMLQSYHLFVFYSVLTISLCNSVENDQPLFRLVPSCLFPLTLILCTLLNFLYFCSFRLQYLKVQIRSGLTYCIKTFLVAIKVNQIGFLAQFKTVFHSICKNIQLIRIFLKVRSNKVLCNIFSVYCTPIYLQILTISHVLSTIL